jgi:hypothetical protein
MALNFFAYASDCTVSGRVDLAGTRLSQYLETNEQLVVEDATLHGLRGEAPARAGRVTLQRHEIYAAEALAGAAGDARNSRRIHTVRHVMRFVSGPYTFVGELHALPGAQPLRSLLHRRSMVPLTQCAVVFARAGVSEVRRAAVVVLNGSLIDNAEPARIEDLGSALAAELAEPLSGG